MAKKIEFEKSWCFLNWDNEKSLWYIQWMNSAGTVSRSAAGYVNFQLAENMAEQALVRSRGSRIYDSFDIEKWDGNTWCIQWLDNEGEPSLREVNGYTEYMEAYWAAQESSKHRSIVNYVPEYGWKNTPTLVPYEQRAVHRNYGALATESRNSSNISYNVRTFDEKWESGIKDFLPDWKVDGKTTKE